ncbi:hypothetical protein POL68_32505 [Stigmatella sp. ncwal1]|uniref:Uncharacterized protein n=1 Tax=Stigmatella ashevillensis TaxID=2995309 RepID=A0ABT5DJJ1_9BACT|nr:hypothetical protein [Stigmatella ashevillena]MDC0713229.1 hypothetical protein [Stigmatella ashevillena]
MPLGWAASNGAASQKGACGALERVAVQQVLGNPGTRLDENA